MADQLPPATNPEPRTIRRRTLDRAGVLRAAADLADRHGMDALTLAAVAEACNVRVPSLYNHITNLADLQQGVANQGLLDLADQLRRAAVGKAGDAALTALAWQYRAFVQAHPGVYALMNRVFQDLDQPDYAPRRDESAAAGGESVAVVAAVLSAYGLRDEQAIHAVRAFRAALHGFSDLERTQGFRIGLDLDDSFHALIGMLIRGLKGMQNDAADADNRQA